MLISCKSLSQVTVVLTFSGWLGEPRQFRVSFLPLSGVASRSDGSNQGSQSQCYRTCGQIFDTVGLSTCEYSRCRLDWPSEWTQANLRTFSAHTLALRPTLAIPCPHLFIVIYFEPLVSVLPFLRPGVAGRQHAYAIYMA